jgi:glucose/mannose-6-phosphate isomerase
VELHQGLEHPQLERHMAATRELIEETLNQVIIVDAEGEGRLAQLLDVIYLGDWMSYYLALQNDVDPGPIDAIAQLKLLVAR